MSTVTKINGVWAIEVVGPLNFDPKPYTLPYSLVQATQVGEVLSAAVDRCFLNARTVYASTFPPLYCSSLRQDAFDCGRRDGILPYYPLLEICVDLFRRYRWSLPTMPPPVIGPCGAEELDTAAAPRDRPPAHQWAVYCITKGKRPKYILARVKSLQVKLVCICCTTVCCKMGQAIALFLVYGLSAFQHIGSICYFFVVTQEYYSKGMHYLGH